MENRLIYKTGPTGGSSSQQLVEILRSNQPGAIQQAEHMLVDLDETLDENFLKQFESSLEEIDPLEHQQILKNLALLETEIEKNNARNHLALLRDIVVRTNPEVAEIAEPEDVEGVEGDSGDKGAEGLAGDDAAEGEASEKATPAEEGESGEKQTEENARKGVIDQVDQVLDTLLPESLSKKQKRALAVATVGLAVLVGFVASRMRAGKGAMDRAAAAGIGFFGTLAIGAGVALGFKNFGSIDALKKKGEELVGKGKDKAVGLAEAGRKKVDDFFDGSSGEKYGLEDADYDNAVTLYKRGDFEGVRAKFGLSGDEESPEYDKFIEDMREIYDKVIPVEVGDTKFAYKRAQAAFEAYEADMENALSVLTRWIQQHQYQLILAGTIVGGSTGILAVLQNAGLGLGERIKAAGAFFARLGKNHPIAAFLALGGTIIVIRAAMQSKKGDYSMPKDTPVLVAAINANAPLPSPVNDGVIPEEALEEMKEAAAYIEDIDTDMATWVGNKLGSLLEVADETIASWLTLKKTELVAKRNEEAFAQLKKTLSNKINSLEEDEDARHSGQTMNCVHALGALKEYEAVYLAYLLQDENDEEQVPLSDVQERLAALRTALSQDGVDIHCEAGEDGILRWQDTSSDGGMDEMWSLSVHPDYLDDPDAMNDKSKELYSGKNVAETAMRAFVAKLKVIHEGNKDMAVPFAVEGLTGSETLGVISGDFVYIFKNVGLNKSNLEYVVAPIELLYPGGVWDERETWQGWSVNFGEKAAVATVVTLSAATTERLSRFFVGGGSVPLSKTQGLAKFLFVDINPITSPGSLAHRGTRFGRDVRVFKNAAKYLPNESGKALGLVDRLSKGRGINIHLQKAGIRPEWIRHIENPNADIRVLEKIARKVGVKTGIPYDVVGRIKYEARRVWDKVPLKRLLGMRTGLQSGVSRTELAEQLRRKVILQLRNVERVKEGGQVTKETIARADEIYHAVNRAMGGAELTDEAASQIANAMEEATSGSSQAAGGGDEAARTGSQVADDLDEAARTGSELAENADEAVRTGSNAAAGSSALDDTVDDAVRETADDWLRSEAIKNARAQYADEAAELFDDAVRKAHSLGLASNADDAAKMLADPAVTKILGAGSDDMVAALAEASRLGTGGKAVQSVQRCAQYVGALDEIGDVASHLLKPAIIQEVCNTRAIRPAVAARYFSNLKPDQLANGVSYFRKQMLAIRSHPALYGVAVGGAALGVAVDIYEIHQMNERINSVAEKIENLLLEAKDHTGQRAFQKIARGGDMIFQHKDDPDIEINVSVIVDEGLEKLDDAAWYRLSISGGSLATAILAPSLALGPAGLAVGAVLLTAHIAGGTAIEQRKKYEILTQDLPMPLVIRLGMSTITGKSTFDTIREHGNRMIGLGEGERNNMLKHAFIEKFAVQLGEVAREMPEVRQEILGDNDTFEFFSEDGEFFKKDFRTIVAPYIMVRLLEDSNRIGGLVGSYELTWGDAKNLSIMSSGDEWLSWIGMQADKVDETVLDRAIRGSAKAYAMHIRQTRTRRKIFEQQQIIDNEKHVRTQQGEMHSEHEVGLRASSDRRMEKAKEEIARLRSTQLLGTTMGTLLDLEKKRATPALRPGESDVQRLIQQAFTNVDDKLSVDSTAADARKLGDVFTVDLPAHLFPERENRSLSIRQLYNTSLESNAFLSSHNDVEQYNKILDRCEEIQDMLDPRGKAHMEAGITEDEYNAVLSYGTTLFAAPQYDRLGVRHAIQELPRNGWTMLRQGNLKNKKIKELRSLLNEQEKDLHARFYELFPGRQKSEVPETPDSLAIQGERILFPSLTVNGYRQTQRQTKERIEENIVNLNARGEMVLSEDGSYYRRKKPDGTWYEYRYFTQEDGTIYAESLDDNKPDRVFAGRGWEDAEESDRVHTFRHRFGKEVFIQTEQGEVFRFEATGDSGEYPLPGGAGIVHYKHVLHPRYRAAGKVRVLTWHFEGRKPGKYRLFRKNHLDIEEPGRWIEVKDTPDETHEMLTGPDYHFYPHHIFGCHIELVSGKVIDLPAQPKTMKVMKENVEVLNRELDGVMEIVSERGVDLDGRILWEDKKENTYYNWRKEKLGWRFNIKDHTAIKAFKLTRPHDDKRLTEVVDIPRNASEESTRKEGATRLPEKVSRDFTAPFTTETLLYPRPDFTILLELSDGRTVSGNRRDANTLQRYLEFSPTDVSRGKNQQRSTDGWYITPRNPQAIRKIDFVYSRESDDNSGPSESTLTLSL